MKKILLAEDDADFAGVLKMYLEIHGYAVSYCKDGEEALQLSQKEIFDICILDVMMPKLDGFTLAEKMNTDTPFIFLTARKLKEDKIKGLKLGADDYIVKPFEVDELVLRIGNILKRSEKRSSIPTEDTFTIGQYTLNTNRLELKFESAVQQLTQKEAALVIYLYHNRNRLLKRDEILKAIWQTDDFFSGRSMDVYISRLRKYFQKDSSIRIESVRHLGLEFKVGY
ncbi:transcriptional regulator [Flavobacterium rivuli WB 3.3-2 = DSM 21788]|uniref:Transcriptional regulator n=1 Tax=Flavobacterium rivuli WB 3.3-2 = DSM 21788 TaxID=1121895 RepID=A0A0A2MJ55_9FLAO|nr:response regulator transcription factor [Flavobacterium rivuli]KGO88355.1 transcriptional regulator [Flavobacterium rivuli WB 3.3-2 = DSM 21788]